MAVSITGALTQLRRRKRDWGFMFIIREIYTLGIGIKISSLMALIYLKMERVLKES